MERISRPRKTITKSPAEASTIMPLNAARWSGAAAQSQSEEIPAVIKAMIDSPPVSQRWPRREKASTIITITPATLTITSGAISEKLISGLAAWNAKNIFCVKQRDYCLNSSVRVRLRLLRVVSWIVGHRKQTIHEITRNQNEETRTNPECTF